MPTSDASRPIVVTHAGRTTAISRDRVYFAFGDGRLAYDCVTCGAKCCRHNGFDALVDPELQRHLAERHALRFFLDRCDAGADNHYHARNFDPACFFLDDRNLCSLHVQHGFAAKPETCRLFPFNQFTRAGDYLMVGPHSLCPLAVAPQNERSELSGHDELLRAMSAGGLGTHVHESALAAEDVPALVSLERRILDLCEHDLKVARYASNAAAQLAFTRAGARGSEADAAVRDRARADIEGFLVELHQVLGESPRAGDDAPVVVQAMIAMTPAIRSQLVFVDGTATQGGLERVPRFMLALHTLAALAHETGMARIGCQTVLELQSAYRSLLLLLANVDRVVAWRSGTNIDIGVSRNRKLQTSYLGAAKALLPSVQRRAPTPLGRILREHAPQEGVDRIVFLKLLARRMDGRFVTLDDAPSSSRWLRRPRAAVKQWALQHLDPDVLTRLADRRRRKAT
jgi:Fe-S-cluster containining protein